VVRAVTIAMQQRNRQTLNNGATLFSVGSVQRGYLEDHRRYRVQFAGGDRHGKSSAGARHGEFSAVLGRRPTRIVLGRRPTRIVLGRRQTREVHGRRQSQEVNWRSQFRSVKVLSEVCYEDYEGMKYWRVRL
jgi:hypothetical protein